MRIPFTKMSGAGNDFVVIDNRRKRIKNGAAFARNVCDRRWGIGADGLLLIAKSRKADYRMMYYNADGSYGGMCGNGGRCIALFSASTRIAKKRHTFEALGYIYHAEVSKSRVKLRMKNPKDLKLNIVLPVKSKRLKMHFINTGSPHVVVPVSSSSTKAMEAVDVEGIGRFLRYHKRFQPAGTNVNFIQRVDNKSIQMRTYERGVEAETLACGTGSVACAMIATKLWKMKPPVRVITRSKQILLVNFKISTDSFRDITLTGPARITFTGTVQV